MVRETDLYFPLKSWLENDGYEVYPEISPKSLKKKADIVAKYRNMVSVIEMKVAMNLLVIEQAYAWKKHAHFIYIAIPKANKRLSKTLLSILKECKIGVLEVDLKNQKVYTHQKADFNIPIFSEKVNWDKELKPELKDWIVGGVSSGVAYKSGYICRKRAKERTYIYLRRSYRENNKVKHEYVYSFGPMPDALEKMYWLRDNPEEFPEELKQRHFDLVDLYDWIMTMETKVTPTGRIFEI